MDTGTAQAATSEKPLDWGSLCISIDLESLWGTWDRVSARDVARSQSCERPVVARLVEMFDRHHITATWAIVARLVDASRGFDGLLGPRACWYAPDLLESIQRAAVAHEIGSHSYGHVYFDQISAAEAREDLERAAEAHRRLGLRFDSFVFPRNGVAHLNELKRVGIRVFRSIDVGVLEVLGRFVPRLRPAANLGEKMFGLPAPLVLPRVHRDVGLVELPSSGLLMGRDGIRRLVHPAVMRHKLTSALRRAATEKQLFHLWFHPSNFYTDGETQFAILDAVLSEAAKLRERGILAVRTMGDFAEAEAAA